MVARLTPDQKVACSIHVRFTFFKSFNNFRLLQKRKYKLSIFYFNHLTILDYFKNGNISYQYYTLLRKNLGFYNLRLIELKFWKANNYFI